MKCTIQQRPTGNPLTDAQLFSFSQVSHLYDGQDPKSTNTYEKRATDVVEWFDDSHRRVVVDALTKYGRRIDASPLQLASLERLRDPRSVAIVTGQQAGLLTGPFLSISKALSAVGLAAQLEHDLGRPVVPVFWVASEDHDFAEVDHAYILNQSHQVTRVSLLHEFDSHQMVYHQELDEVQVNQVLQTLHTSLPELPYKVDMLTSLKDAFHPGDTLSVWFARLMAQLLKDHPIVIADPCLTELRQLVGPVFAKTLERFDEIQSGLQTAYDEVAEQGYVHEVVRDETNSCVFQVINGRRYVVERVDNEFQIRSRGQVLDQSELSQSAIEHPIEFSSNVLLRPVVQDHLFPTLAYVGGPSEIAYHTLSRAVFHVHGRYLPPLVLRQRLRLTTPAIIRTMEQWGLSMDAVSQPVDLVRQYALHDVAEDLGQRIQEVSRTWSESLGQLARDYRTLGPQVDDIVGRQMTRHRDLLRRLERKFYSLAKRKNMDAVRQLERIEHWFWADGHEQERRICPVNVWAEFGETIFSQLPTWGNYRQTGPYIDVILE